MDVNDTLEILIEDRLGLDMLFIKRRKWYPKIIRSLKRNTLKVFSQFFPFEYRFELDLIDSKTPDDNVYYIKLPHTKNVKDIHIISVMQVDNTGISQFNTLPPAYDYESDILLAASTNITSLANKSYRSYKFLPPNKILLRGFGGSSRVGMTVKIPYPSIGFIPDSVSESFMELAEYDLKILLYNKLKRYTELETPEGTIDLKISDWQSAAEDRKSFIRELRNEAFPQTVGGRSRYYE